MFDFLINPPLAYFILRVCLGFLLVLHGYPKLFKNFSQVSAWFDSVGLKPGKFWVLVAGSVEFFGGLAMILGVWVQLVGVLFAFQMLVAMWKVKWGRVGITAQGGWELDLIYAVAAFSLAMTGEGAYSL